MSKIRQSKPLNGHTSKYHLCVLMFLLKLELLLTVTSEGTVEESGIKAWVHDSRLVFVNEQLCKTRFLFGNKKTVVLYCSSFY